MSYAVQFKLNTEYLQCHLEHSREKTNYLLLFYNIMEALPLGTVEKTPGITSRPMRGWPTSGLWGPLFDSRVCSPLKENQRAHH